MIPKDFETAHAEVVKLVQTFADNLSKFHESHYNESAVRKDFIDKFFIALGWDVNHDEQTNPYEQEVKVERNVSVAARVKKADYAFFLKPNFGVERFFVEAKRPSAVLDTPDNCFQTIRYAYSSSRAAFSLLTNFKELYVMDCRFRPDIKTVREHVHLKFHFTDFYNFEKFAEVYYLFGREAVAEGSLEKYVESLPKPKGFTKQRKLFADAFQEIDELFLAQLEEYRTDLAKMFKRKNTRLTSEDLTEAVQRTLDRIVFIRFLEDKLIEPATILDKLVDKQSAWEEFISICRRFDKTYNGIIFKQHPIVDSPSFEVDNKVFRAVIGDFSDKYSPYHFNYIPIHILGSIYERFLGNVIVATAKQARVEKKPEVKKAGGVFYTPQYIVNYIVENTIGKLLGSVPGAVTTGVLSEPRAVATRVLSEPRAVATGAIGKRSPVATAPGSDKSFVTPADVAKMRFADIACGSGSFLLGVYDYLLRWHTAYYNSPKGKRAAKQDGCITNDDGTFTLSFEQKREILVNNIYGVDIDRQAHEVTQLSLFLKLLEDETQGSSKQYLTGHRESLLPSLAGNIVCGNALVDWDISSGDLFEQLDQEKEKRLNPMSFEQTFPEIMRNGGFDAIVGNPPWVSLTGRFRNEIIAADVVTYLIARFNGNTYMPNLYEYFVAQVLTLVKDGGFFSYIVPDRLGYNSQFVELRKRILIETRISSLVYKFPFPGIVADTLVFVVQKGFRESNAAEIGEYGIELLLVPQSELEQNEGNSFQYFENKEIKEFTARLVSNPSVVLLRDVCDTTSGFGGKSELVSEFQITDQQIPVFKGDSIQRYETRKRYWFEFARLNITGRTTDRRKLGAKPKVLLRKTGSSIVATFDETGTFPEQSLYFLFDNRSEMSFKFFLALLNSKLLNFFYQSKLLTNKKSIAQVKKIDLDQIPIRTINFNDPSEKTTHDSIVRSVEQIMIAKERLAAAVSESDIEF